MRTGQCGKGWWPAGRQGGTWPAAPWQNQIAQEETLAGSAQGRSAVRMSIGVLFVCTGNICRSPTADGIFARIVQERGLGDVVRVDSCGTHDYHPGKPTDSRARRAAARRGYDLSDLRARVIEDRDFADFDYLLAMDRSNYHDLLRHCPGEHEHKVQMFLSFAPELGTESVPDPYYGGADGFESVLDLVELGSRRLLDHIQAELKKST